MPKPFDLRREGQIRELRSHGLRIREIARQLGASPSTISRVLRRDVNREALKEVKNHLSLCDSKLSILEECVSVISDLCLQINRPTHRQQLNALLLKWPDSRLKRFIYGGSS